MTQLLIDEEWDGVGVRCHPAWHKISITWPSDLGECQAEEKFLTAVEARELAALINRAADLLEAAENA